MTASPTDDIVIRECTTISELDSCVQLQKEVFRLPDLEISPRRHLIVSRQAGGWTLGAFAGDRLIGFVHNLAAVRDGNEIFGYSHMMAVQAEYQNKGVGARLKWSQRARALSEGRNFIKWTWDPMQARNAHFNLNRLGVTVSSYAPNFYGTDYPDSPESASPGIDSDRLFASWQLSSPRVNEFAERRIPEISDEPEASIEIPASWTALLKEDPVAARDELLRVRDEFQTAFASGLVCAAFEREGKPKYLLFEKKSIR